MKFKINILSIAVRFGWGPSRKIRRVSKQSVHLTLIIAEAGRNVLGEANEANNCCLPWRERLCWARKFYSEEEQTPPGRDRPAIPPVAPCRSRSPPG